MHCWGDVDANGNDICYQIGNIAEYIGEWLRKYARINVMQYKEKFGTVRVYCYFGWDDLGSITHPGYYYRPKWGSYCRWIRHLNWLIVPLQIAFYRLRYKQAIKKWPHLQDEILCCADYHDLLEGLWKNQPI